MSDFSEAVEAAKVEYVTFAGAEKFNAALDLLKVMEAALQEMTKHIDCSEFAHGGIADCGHEFKVVSRKALAAADEFVKKLEGK